MPNDVVPNPALHESAARATAVLPAEPVVVSLAELGVVAVRGADAAKFLQSQLTNDVTELDTVAVQLNGYCTAKGRLLAVFDQWRDGDAVYLQLPREILAPVSKRLAMFVLRAKAALSDDSSAWHTWAIFGRDAVAAIRKWNVDLPELGATTLVDGARVTRLPGGARGGERIVIRAPLAAAATWRTRCATLTAAPLAQWWWSQIDAGVPAVLAATQEKFVPQMINLEVLGGVNFKKGCYPGQEVVARSQYLGKLRRRMALAHCDEASRPGADIYAEGSAQPVGTVVLAAAAPDRGFDILFECPVAHTAARTTAAAPAVLRVNRVDGAPLVLQSLPYELFDVTA